MWKFWARNMATTKVLIVTDSTVLGQVLGVALAADPSIVVVGVAPDEILAREIVRDANPDVIVLDLEPMRIDSLAFLGKLMRARPIPVVVVFSLIDESIELAIRALEQGAVDFVSRPDIDVRENMPEISRKIVERVHSAAVAAPRSPTFEGAPAWIEPASMAADSTRVIALGACTGGVNALRQILLPLPENSPGLVIVQHMPTRFTATLARRLNEESAIRVVEAEEGSRVSSGVALLAPGNFHMRLKRDDAGYFVTLDQSESVMHHRPSIDVLFESVATCAGPNAVGALLSGSGSDGAMGLLAMHRAGAPTLCQDQATSVQFDLPRSAIRLGAHDEVLSVRALATRIYELSMAPVFPAPIGLRGFLPPRVLGLSMLPALARETAFAGPTRRHGRTIQLGTRSKRSKRHAATGSRRR